MKGSPNATTKLHPRRSWNRWRDTIGHLYLDENWTMPEIATHLTSYGMVCNHRQIKNRLKDWGWELKKTPTRHYLAMMAVAEEMRKDGDDDDIVFRVPKRRSTEHYDLKRVSRACLRAKKRLDEVQKDFALPSVEDARLVLEDAGITADFVRMSTALEVSRDSEGRLMVEDSPPTAVRRSVLRIDELCTS
ncbi:hypothetical protein H2204_011971 [Knufia peltigerae]|uniref:Clr5 domain-containing protein n=1 Tax=Knufia peltigerae TaxID=1002370 RepID=A0AA38XUF6_9EURO|nr:hypothetical protein H2204_011971 [Knufia peltigerae]